MDRDHSRSRAILISNSIYRDHPAIHNLPAAAGCVPALEALLTSDLCGWPAGRVARFQDEAAPSILAEGLIDLVRDVEDLLLLYYVGHGLRTASGLLALALRDTSPRREKLPHTAMMYRSIAEILRESSATTKVVILDCCHAELANKDNFQFQSADLDAEPVDGLYCIFASKAWEKARAPVDGNLTYFTQAFIDVIRTGIPGSPSQLTIDQIFTGVRARMLSTNLPEPAQSGVRDAHHWPFARNSAPAQTHRDLGQEITSLRQQKEAAEARQQELQAEVSLYAAEVERLRAELWSSQSLPADTERRPHNTPREAGIAATQPEPALGPPATFQPRLLKDLASDWAALSDFPSPSDIGVVTVPNIVRIGRSPDNNIVIPDLSVSTYHAELRKLQSGRYRIVDLGSHNGTYVNGIQVDQAELTQSDIVAIGHVTLRLVGDELVEYVDEGDVAFEAHGLRVRVRDGGKGKGKVLLDGITFSVPERSLMTVIGPTGAGKSTLLNALTGKHGADEGTVLYDHRDLYAHYAELRHRIGLVPEESVTHGQLTVKAALRYTAALRFPLDTGEAERNGRVDEVLGELGMIPHANTRIEHLSGGQRKRVNIGLELLTKPSLLFLDEPTSPLDPHLKREFFQQMRDLAHDGRTVVMVTHDIESKLLDYCDRLLVLVPGGRMAYYGPPQEGLAYFGKDDWADVFADFIAYRDRDWAGEFRASPIYMKYVSIPTTARQPVPQPWHEYRALPPRQRGWTTQVFTMARRYTRVMSLDRAYLTLTVLLPLTLGLLVRFLPAPQGLGGAPHTNAAAGTLLLVLTLSACLTGGSNAVREIIKEHAVFLRERMAGLSAGAYLGSKALVLSLVCVLQTAIIVVIGLSGRQMPVHGAVIGSAFIEILVAMALLCTVSMLAGLTVSALVTNTDQVMPALVGITMIQVALSGAVFPLGSVIAWISDIIPARWGMSALASTVNLNQISPLGSHQDAAWARTRGNWLVDIGVSIALAMVFIFLTWNRLSKLHDSR